MLIEASIIPFVKRLSSIQKLPEYEGEFCFYVVIFGLFWLYLRWHQAGGIIALLYQLSSFKHQSPLNGPPKKLHHFLKWITILSRKVNRRTLHSSILEKNNKRIDSLSTERYVQYEHLAATHWLVNWSIQPYPKENKRENQTIPFKLLPSFLSVHVCWYWIKNTHKKEERSTPLFFFTK